MLSSAPAARPRLTGAPRNGGVHAELLPSCMLMPAGSSTSFQAGDEASGAALNGVRGGNVVPQTPYISEVWQDRSGIIILVRERQLISGYWADVFLMLFLPCLFFFFCLFRTTGEDPIGIKIIVRLSWPLESFYERSMPQAKFIQLNFKAYQV